MIEAKTDQFVESDMSQDQNNPFTLPGMTNAFMNPASNPLLTSMDMMRQAIGHMGYGNASLGDSTAYSLAPEDLERRIADLRVVENWLKLNLSMLTSSIQGMEVQLATVNTLRSVVAMGAGATGDATATPSPLEVVLGLKPKPSTAPSGVADNVDQAKPEAQSAPAESANSSMEQMAAQNWWNMLENQFSQIAAATAQAAKLGEQANKPTASKSTRKPASAAPKSQRAPRKATKSATRNKKSS